MDTINGIDDSIAVRDLFNEWHARDTSKKVKAVIMAAAWRGERNGTLAPYGCKKNGENPKHLIPDEQTAPVVSRIFELCAGGLGPDTLLNADRFRRLVDKYTDITELVWEFIQRVEIHERSGRYRKKHYTQQVDIYFNFIGHA